MQCGGEESLAVTVEHIEGHERQIVIIRIDLLGRAVGRCCRALRSSSDFGQLSCLLNKLMDLGA
jgi:hypothetical protein